MTHPTWGDKPPRVAGSLPPMRPDQELQVALTRAGSGPAPQSPVVVARLVLVGGGTVSGVFVYDPTIGFGHLVGWMTDSALDPFGNVDHPVVGAGNPATTAAGFLTKNANLHFTTARMTFDSVLGAQDEGAGSTPYTAPNATWVSPAQAGSSGQMQWTLLGGDKETAKGPFALLGPVTIGGVAGQYYANQTCWYAPGTTTVDDGAALNALIALGIRSFRILPGTFNLITPVSYTSSVTNPISITAPYGEVFVQWTPVANTIAWKWHGSAQASGTFGELSGLTFDGLGNLNTVQGAVLLDVGDITNSLVDVTVQNLPGTGTTPATACVGFRVSNDANQTELNTFRVISRFCQVPMYHRKTGAGTASLARTDMDYKVLQGAPNLAVYQVNQAGPVFDSVNPYAATLRIRGNCQATNHATNPLAGTNIYVAAQPIAALTLAGTAELDGMYYDIAPECGTGGLAGPFDTPFSIIMATPSGTNFLNGRGIIQMDKGGLEFGLINQAAGAFPANGTNMLTNSGNTLANACFEFAGIVGGVPDLNPFNPFVSPTGRPVHINGCLVNDQMAPVTAGGIIRMDGGKRSYLTLTANVTVVTFSGLGGVVPGGTWNWDIVWHNAAGNVFTVTGYPAGIKWVGGAAPVMPAGGASGTWQKVKITSVIDNTSGTPVQVLLGESNNYS